MSTATHVHDGPTVRLRDAATIESAAIARWAAVAAVLAITLLIAGHAITSAVADSYMSLYVGRWISQHGLPAHEVFTAAAHARPWVDQQWLAEWLDYGAYRIGGYAGLGLFNALAVAGAFAGLAALMIARRTSPLIALLLCALTARNVQPALFIRSQDLVFAGFVALLAICLTDSDRPAPGRRLLLLVPLLAVWANLHGSVLEAAGLAAAYLLWRVQRSAAAGDRTSAWRCAALAGVVALTPLLTPYGLHIVSYYHAILTNPGVALAAPEDRAVALSSGGGIFCLAVIGLSGVMTVARRLPAVLFGALVITGVAFLAAGRAGVWFMIVLAVATAHVLATALAPVRLPRPAAGALAAIAAVGVGLGIWTTAHPHGGYERTTPVGVLGAAAAYLNAHPHAVALGDDLSSSALLWQDPQLAQRVLFDARLEQYTPAQLRRWVTYQWSTGADWAASTRGAQVLIGASVPYATLVWRLAHAPHVRLLASQPQGIAVIQR